MKKLLRTLICSVTAVASFTLFSAEQGDDPDAVDVLDTGSITAKQRNTSAFGGYTVTADGNKFKVETKFSTKLSSRSGHGRGNLVIVLLDRNGNEIWKQHQTLTISGNPTRSSKSKSMRKSYTIIGDQAAKLTTGASVAFTVYVDAVKDLGQVIAGSAKDKLKGLAKGELDEFIQDGWSFAKLL